MQTCKIPSASLVYVCDAVARIVSARLKVTHSVVSSIQLLGLDPPKHINGTQYRTLPWEVDVEGWQLRGQPGYKANSKSAWGTWDHILKENKTTPLDQIKKRMCPVMRCMGMQACTTAKSACIQGCLSFLGESIKLPHEGYLGCSKTFPKATRTSGFPLISGYLKIFSCKEV